MKQTRSSNSRNWLGPIVLLALVAFPFILALLTGQPVTAGTPKFWQGMLIQVFILAVYAMSYDLMLGYTGILSFGHAMFFGVGAYGTGFVVETSVTLAGTWTPETLAPAGNVTITGNDVTYTFPTPLGARKFARLKVTGP